MVRHAGRWANNLSSDDILTIGNALMGPFQELSHQDFEAFAKQEYEMDYRRSLDIMNTTKRFKDKPDLIRGFPETIIRKLAAPCLEELYEQIIFEIRTAKDQSCRAVDKIIKKYKESTRADKKEEEADTPSEFTYFPQSAPLPKTALDVIEAEKNELEGLKLESEEDLISLDREKVACETEFRAKEIEFKAKLENIKKKKLKRRAEIKDFDNHIQSFIQVLKLHGRISSMQGDSKS